MRRTAFALVGAALVAAVATLAGQSSKAIDPRNMDTSVKPCDDFYQYADGSWIKANPVPADKSRWGAFEELADRNRDTLKAILQEVSAKRTWPAGSIESSSRRSAWSFLSNPASSPATSAAFTP